MISYLKFVSNSIIFIVLCGSIMWLVFWTTAGAKVYSVQSASMQPLLHKGDLLFDTAVNPSELKTGDIVSYQSSEPPKTIVTHRIVSINYKKQYLITKGDNLKINDSPVSFKQLTGKAFKAVPKAGYVFDELHTPLGLVGFVYLPALLIAYIEIWSLAAKVKSPPNYQLTENA